ncbi:MAG: hypothetical protein VW338_03495 [Rhodospirillaceae bacterium]
MTGCNGIIAPPFIGGTAFTGGAITSPIVPPDNSYALQSPTRSIGFAIWDGWPAIKSGTAFTSSWGSGGYTLANNMRLGWSSTTTGGEAWRDTALERGGAGVVIPYQDATHVLGSASRRFKEAHFSGAIGQWGATPPSSQPAAIADATGGAVFDAQARTAINSLLTAIRDNGIIAT